MAEDASTSPSGGEQERVTGMQTGSDAGAPGEHLPEPPLDDDERRLRDDLLRDEGEDVVEPIEASPEAVEAAEDDSPLPQLSESDE